MLGIDSRDGFRGVSPGRLSLLLLLLLLLFVVFVVVVWLGYWWVGLVVWVVWCSSSSGRMRAGLGSQETDPSLLHARVNNFLQNIDKLFIAEGCVDTGLTKRMLRIIREKRIWFHSKEAF